MGKGFLAVPRWIFEDERWLSEPFTRSMAHIDLLAHARYAAGRITYRGVTVELARGEVAWSEEYMAKRWRWSRGKVRRFLAKLESEQQIVQRKSNLTTVIAITNYDAFESDGTAGGAADGTANGTANGTADGTADGTQKNKATIQHGNNLSKVDQAKSREFSEEEITEIHRRSQEILATLKTKCQNQDHREALSKWVALSRWKWGERWLENAVEGTRLLKPDAPFAYMWTILEEKTPTLKMEMAKIILPEALKHSPEWSETSKRMCDTDNAEGCDSTPQQPKCSVAPPAGRLASKTAAAANGWKAVPA